MACGLQRRSARGHALAPSPRPRAPVVAAAAAATAAAATAAAAAAAAAAAPVAALLQEGWPLWTGFAACAALGQLVERRTPVGGVLSGPLVSMLLALAAAAVGLLPTASGAADAIWTYLMPLGAALILLESDLSQLLSSAGPTLVAFVVGAVGTVLGTSVAYWLVGPRLGPEGYKVAASLCASYIGGALNFAAVSQALALAPGPVLAGAMTADNCVMALYIAVIMSIPAEDSRAAGAAGGGAEVARPAVTVESLTLAALGAALACTLGNAIAAAAGAPSSGIAVMALLASGGAVLTSKLGAWLAGRRAPAASPAASAAANLQQAQQAQPTPFAGAEALGNSLMMLFFATIGAAAGSLQALGGSGWMVLFILLQLSIHLAVCLAGGRWLRLPMQAVLIASNANVGGPATAAAMATSKGWTHMIQPAMLTGALGYAIANGIGLLMAGWMRGWFVFGA